MVSTMPASPTHDAIFMESLANPTLLFLRRNQQLTPTTNAAPSTHPERTVWKNLLTATGERATSANDTITLRIWAGSNSIPTGYCIHALATRIHSAERLAPIAVSHVAARWNPGLTLFHPKNITAIKVDSRKNATMPSIAKGAPKMSPTNHE